MKRVFKRLLQLISILLFLYCFLPWFFPVETKQLSSSELPYHNSQFILVNRTRIHYRVWTPKQIENKVFFLHGFAGSTFSFRKNIDSLVAHNSLVVAMDLPGFGFSDKSDTADYSMENIFKVIDQLLADNNSVTSQKWTFIGHSMGAAIVSVYAGSHFDNVKNLVLIGGAPLKNREIGVLSRIVLKFPPTRRWADVMMKNYFVKEKRFEELLSSAYSQKPLPEDVAGYMKPFTYTNSGSAVMRFFSAAGGKLATGYDLKKFPLTVIWGSNDTWLPVDIMYNCKKENPQAKTYLINGAGHCPMETHAAEVNKILVNSL